MQFSIYEDFLVRCLSLLFVNEIKDTTTMNKDVRVIVIIFKK